MAHTNTQARAHARVRARCTHARTHAYTRTHTHTHARARTQTNPGKPTVVPQGESINFNSGLRTASVGMSVADYVAVERPVACAVTV